MIAMEGEKPKAKKLNFITKLIARKQAQERDQELNHKDQRRSIKGAHLFHNKTIEEETRSTPFNKTEFSKLLVNIIKAKTSTHKTENKIYNFYKEAPHKKISVIKQFYTPDIKPEVKHDSKVSHSLLITGVVKNKNEKKALQEYVSNKRTDCRLYNSILRNILDKGYKKLPEKNSLTVSYGYTFDEKNFMKYSLITKKETNLGYILNTLKKQYIVSQDKPKSFLSVSNDIKSARNLKANGYDIQSARNFRSMSYCGGGVQSARASYCGNSSSFLSRSVFNNTGIVNGLSSKPSSVIHDGSKLGTIVNLRKRGYSQFSGNFTTKPHSPITD
jgi:hypothetical protein